MTSSLPAPIEFGQPCPIQPSSETLALLAGRRSSSAMTLQAPAPNRDQLADLLRIAARAPDHGKLNPWRFVVLEGEGKDRYVKALQAIAAEGGHNPGALGKLATPPLAVAVVSHVKPSGKAPEWEQVLSAGAVCTLLLVAAEAMGFGANWITDWYAYDAKARAALGLESDERIAGFVYLGTPGEQPLERVRPEVDQLITEWR